MKPVSYLEAGPYREIELLGRKMLCTDLRVDKESLPDGLYVYDLRHEDENWGNPCEIQKKVIVNHYGAVITDEIIDLGKEGYIDFDPYDDFGFTDHDSVEASDIMKYFSESYDDEEAEEDAQ